MKNVLEYVRLENSSNFLLIFIEYLIFLELQKLLSTMVLHISIS